MGDQPRSAAGETGVRARTATRQPGADGTQLPVPTIVEPGRNCWRVERADRFRCIQDAADYFRLVRQALLAARHTVFVLGWDIFSEVDLLPGAAESDAPTRLDDLLGFVARRRPGLRCYILIWDYAALYTLERDPLTRWRLRWKTPRRVTFGFDDHIPFGGSHHQKVVVIDDQLAFCGGIDLTGHRWDTSAHRVDEPARTSGGEPYAPYHEVHTMATGAIAASLGVLARDRWRALGEKPMPPVRPSTHDLWPSEIVPDLTDVNVAIARTMPESERQVAIRECEALFLDSIAQAKRSIYIESQYFTNERLGDALAERLNEPDGPEIVVVSPRDCHGWLEQNTMGAFRDRVFRRLIAADAQARLRLVYPAASRARGVPTFVHSKVMVVDDELVRIGSANFSRRSMGVDTECDLAVDAGGDPRVRAGIRHIRDRLLGEHLALPAPAVARGIERLGSLRALVDESERADHTLLRIELPASDETPPLEALRAAADPDQPIFSGSPVDDIVPPVDVAERRGPLRFRIVIAIVFGALVVALSAALVERPEFRALQGALSSTSSSGFLIGGGAFLVANVALVPLELLAIAAGLLFGVVRGGMAALLGSVVAASVGYAVGRAIGPIGLRNWMSRRAYRSGVQLGARGIIGVLVLRLASIASAGSIHLLCGAGRVPFATYLTGSLLGLSPAMFALSGLGALLRQTLLDPSLSHVLVLFAAAVLVLAGAALVRALLLIRRFAPSVARHRAGALFG
jgi:phospholipase D1/2